MVSNDDLLMKLKEDNITIAVFLAKIVYHLHTASTL